MEKDFHRTFTKCPCCESENRFFEQLGNELKERGLARDEWSFHLEVKQGVALDQTKEAAIPIGSELPGYGYITDICMDCGCMYAIDLKRLEAKKSLPPVQPLMPPNRAQRRREDRGGLVGPFSSS